MCQFKNWYADAGGYVIQCEDCKHFQVSFGTTMLTLDEQQYSIFTHSVLHRREEHICMPDPDCKCIILPTPSGTVHIILSERELFQLYEMMQTVDVDIKTNLMLSLFSE